MRLSGSGQQGVWMYAVYSSSVTGVFWGTTQRRGDVSQGLTTASLLLYSSGQRCRKPTLFFFLWSSRESLSSASSPCRSETCFSFSDNLVGNNITTCYEHNYEAKHPWEDKCVCVWNMMLLWYSTLLTLWEALDLALLCLTAVGEEKHLIKSTLEWEFNVIRQKEQNVGQLCFLYPDLFLPV